jgi:SAM-dependent methyltransferase
MTSPQTPRVVVSQLDVEFLSMLRANVTHAIQTAAERWDAPGAVVLDIAPQVHPGARAAFAQAQVESLDIDPAAGATYTCDLCGDIDGVVPRHRFDVVVCTEVLEHTLDPFAAASNLRDLLKPGGVLLLTTPFNFRVHGPLPDCWRFTEHGLRALLTGFERVEIEALETPDRPLMPVHYVTTAFAPASA